jgi:hypothetical protein
MITRTYFLFAIFLNIYYISKMGSFFKRLFVTYTKENDETGEIYSGRASGIVSEDALNGTSARDILAKRDASHHKNSDGFQRAEIDIYSENSDATRGREQMLIDFNGGAKSEGGTSGNSINGISQKNPKRDQYLETAKKIFGGLKNFVLDFSWYLFNILVMATSIKKQKRTPGSIVKVPLDNGFHIYARVLGVDLAFYDLLTREEIKDLQIIISSPILFITTVNYYAITKGLWTKVGKVSLEDFPVTIPPQFVQNPLNPDQFFIEENGIRRNASKDECQGLERSAVWTPEGIQKRLNDYYKGRKNYYIEKDLETLNSKKEKVA